MGKIRKLKEIKDLHDTQMFLLVWIQIAVIIFLPLKIIYMRVSNANFLSRGLKRLSCKLQISSTAHEAGEELVDKSHFPVMFLLAYGN